MAKKNQGAPRPRVTVSGAREDLRASAQQEGNPGLLIIALIVTTLFMAFYYHFLVMNQMTQLSEGLPMLDHRPGGYSLAEVEQLSDRMSETDLGQLNWIHKTAGVIFPVLFSLTAIAIVLYSARSTLIRASTSAVAVLFAIIDIWENIAVEAALAHPTAESAQLASTLTMIGWILLSVLTIWMVVLLISRFILRKDPGLSESLAPTPR